MVLVLESSKQVVVLKLTVERMEEANDREQAKYANLVEECCRLSGGGKGQGWGTWHESTQVNCRGFVAQTHVHHRHATEEGQQNHHRAAEMKVD